MDLLKGLMIVLLLFLFNCKTQEYTLKDMKVKSEEVKEILESLERNENWGEALVLLKELKLLYGTNERLDQKISSIPPEFQNQVESSFYGMNRGNGYRERRTTVEKILYYFPDRILDLLECFDFWILFGPQLGLKVNATDSLSLGAYAGGYTGIGFGQKKQFGYRTGVEATARFLPMGYTQLNSDIYGTGGERYYDGVYRISYPGDLRFQSYEDYYSFGLRGGISLLGVDIQFHPMEFYDFLGGIFLLDPLRDDFSSYRKLNFSNFQSQALREFREILLSLSEEEIKKYRSSYKY